MTAHRLINIVLTAALVVAMATILSTGHLLDDHSADWSESTALRDAQQAARAARQAELDAIKQCTALHGPGAAVAYTVDGDVVCGPRRGAGSQVIASKGGAL